MKIIRVRNEPPRRESVILEESKVGTIRSSGIGHKQTFTLEACDDKWHYRYCVEMGENDARKFLEALAFSSVGQNLIIEAAGKIK